MLVSTAVVLGVAAPARASSIVFVRGGDVWLTTPDGSREHRVTTGGSYDDVTQADNGTIFATDDGVLHSFAPDGRRLAGPTGTGSTFDLDVSPDGSKIAFWYLTSGGGRYTVLNSNGSAAGWDDQNGWYPTWITNDLTLDSNGAGYVGTTQAGTGTSYYWTGNPDGRKHSSAITRATDRLVVVVRDYEDAGPWSVAHYSNASQPPRSDEGFGTLPPPEGQPTLRCTQGHGATEPRHPRFSPDGAAIAWELPDGVHVKPVFDLASCTQPAGGFTIPGASSPDWGPADVPPPTGPTGPTGPGGPGAADTVAPRLSRAAITNRVFAAARKATPRTAQAAGRKRRRKRGTAFRYRLSEPARVTITIQRALSGRRKGRRCVKPTRKLRKAKRCARYRRVGTLTRTGAQGANRTAFSGRIGRKRLRPGRYRAVIRGTDAAGNRSRPASVKFKVVRP